MNTDYKDECIKIDLNQCGDLNSVFEVLLGALSGNNTLCQWSDIINIEDGCIYILGKENE